MIKISVIEDKSPALFIHLLIHHAVLIFNRSPRKVIGTEVTFTMQIRDNIFNFFFHLSDLIEIAAIAVK